MKNAIKMLFCAACLISGACLGSDPALESCIEEKNDCMSEYDQCTWDTPYPEQAGKCDPIKVGCENLYQACKHEVEEGSATDGEVDDSNGFTTGQETTTGEGRTESESSTSGGSGGSDGGSGGTGSTSSSSESEGETESPNCPEPLCLNEICNEGEPGALCWIEESQIWGTIDCLGTCVWDIDRTRWCDEICDNGDYANFNCETFQFDGGACEVQT